MVGASFVWLKESTSFSKRALVRTQPMKVRTGTVGGLYDFVQMLQAEFYVYLVDPQVTHPLGNPSLGDPLRDHIPSTFVRLPESQSLILPEWDSSGNSQQAEGNWVHLPTVSRGPSREPSEVQAGLCWLRVPLLGLFWQDTRTKPPISDNGFLYFDPHPNAHGLSFAPQAWRAQLPAGFSKARTWVACVPSRQWLAFLHSYVRVPCGVVVFGIVCVCVCWCGPIFDGLSRRSKRMQAQLLPDQSNFLAR